MTGKKSICMSQSVTGPLRNWSDKDWNRNAKAWTKADGGHPTGGELKDFFLKKLGEGWEVLPVGECDNFDRKEGCKGHA